MRFPGQLRWGPVLQHYVRVRDGKSEALRCVYVTALHDEWSAARVFGTLAVPVLHALLLQVDVAGGGVVGPRLQNGPVATEVHEICKGRKDEE